jgi:hypothetical protein
MSQMVLSVPFFKAGGCATVKRHSVPFRLSSVTEAQEVVSLTASADHRHVSLHTRHVGCLALCVDKSAGRPTGQADPWMDCMPGALVNSCMSMDSESYSTLKPDCTLLTVR